MVSSCPAAVSRSFTARSSLTKAYGSTKMSKYINVRWEEGSVLWLVEAMVFICLIQLFHSNSFSYLHLCFCLAFSSECLPCSCCTLSRGFLTTTSGSTPSALKGGATQSPLSYSTTRTSGTLSPGFLILMVRDLRLVL